MDIGLSLDEVSVYKVLLRNNQCTAAELSKLTNIDLMMIYVILSSLKHRGLCCEKQVTVNKFEVVSPATAFREMIDEQKNLMENLLDLSKMFRQVLEKNGPSGLRLTNR
jgi:sugar-specific transcriptional regulator TrmB